MSYIELHWSDKFEYKMKKLCNAMGCEYHAKKFRFVEAHYPTCCYYIFDRQELEEWFACICRENRLICSYYENCYTWKRFHCIKNSLYELGYFVRREWPWELIL